MQHFLVLLCARAWRSFRFAVIRYALAYRVRFAPPVRKIRFFDAKKRCAKKLPELDFHSLFTCNRSFPKILNSGFTSPQTKKFLDGNFADSRQKPVLYLSRIAQIIVEVEGKNSFQYARDSLACLIFALLHWDFSGRVVNTTSNFY